MQTTTRRPARAHKPDAAPFSTAAAKLIEQLQAETRAQLLADLSTKDAIIVLHGFDPETRRVQASGNHITVHDAKGNCVELYRNHTEPESWRDSPHMAGYWHPSHWYGQQTMVDASGAAWRRELTPMVCDDFGNLVEVAA